MSLKKCAWICIGLAMIASTCNPTITPASMPTINPSATPDLAVQAWQELKLGKVSGVDLGMSGERYGLPESVLVELGQMGGAPVVGLGSIIGAKDSTGCSLILPDHLVTGEKVKQATDGVVEYSFDGKIGTESIWKIPVGEGVNCVAFVVKDDNKWGLRSGTVAVWFYQDGGKAGSTVLNPETPLRIMYDAANQAQLTSLENSGVSLTVSDQNGTVIDNQEVKLVPAVVLAPDLIDKMNADLTEDQTYLLKDNTLVYSIAGQETTVARIAGGKVELVLSNGETVFLTAEQLMVAEAHWFVENPQNRLVGTDENNVWRYEWDATKLTWEAKSLPEFSTTVEDKMPEITWDDIVSGRFAQAVHEAVAAGTVPTFGNNTVFVPRKYSENFFNIYGIGIYGFDSEDSQYSQYLTDKSTRPILDTAYATMKLGRMEYTVVGQQNKDSAGNIRVIPLIAHSRFNQYLIQPERYSVPVTRCTAKGCDTISLGDTAYSSWFLEWPGREEGEIQRAVDQWVEKNILEEILEKVPFRWTNSLW